MTNYDFYVVKHNNSEEDALNVKSGIIFFELFQTYDGGYQCAGQNLSTVFVSETYDTVTMHRVTPMREDFVGSVDNNVISLIVLTDPNQPLEESREDMEQIKDKFLDWAGDDAVVIGVYRGKKGFRVDIKSSVHKSIFNKKFSETAH
tara:strand:+ start:1089 stop:1529 length:441 start_codon:yes stop_codon:yes gene_type:complete